MAEVDVRPGWVETELDAQAIAALDAALQVFAVDDVYRARVNHIPGTVIKVLLFLHRSVTVSRREYIGARRDPLCFFGELNRYRRGVRRQAPVRSTRRDPRAHCQAAVAAAPGRWAQDPRHRAHAGRPPKPRRR